MHIEPKAPHRVSKFGRNSKFKLDLLTAKAVTVLADVPGFDDAKLFTRVATKPFADHMPDERYLAARLVIAPPDHDLGTPEQLLFVYVHGDHVVITTRDLVITSRPKVWDQEPAPADRAFHDVSAGMDAEVDSEPGAEPDTAPTSILIYKEKTGEFRNWLQDEPGGPLPKGFAIYLGDADEPEEFVVHDADELKRILESPNAPDVLVAAKRPKDMTDEEREALPLRAPPDSYAIVGIEQDDIVATKHADGNTYGFAQDSGKEWFRYLIPSGQDK